MFIYHYPRNSIHLTNESNLVGVTVSGIQFNFQFLISCFCVYLDQLDSVRMYLDFGHFGYVVIVVFKYKTSFSYVNIKWVESVQV